MAKRFFFVSLGILMLAIAYSLGAERARADWDTSVPGQIVGGYENYWFTADGSAWNMLGEGGTWERDPYRDLPVPTSEVKFLADTYLITVDDVGYWYYTDSWILAGPFPGGPVPVESESAGSVKGKYR